MYILAISQKEKEFFYNPKSARKVSKRSCKLIANICNEYNFLLKPGEIWSVHEVDQYDTAYEYALYQSFTIRNGIVTARAK